MADLPARRIMVYGVTGTGKSTFARRLAAKLGREWISVDDLTFGPNWVTVPKEEQRAIFTEICARDEWLIDTAYGQWIDIPLARVELIIGLDYPRWVSLSRLVRRTLMRVIDKKPICNNNVETWRQTLSRESIIAWHFRSFKRKRQRIQTWAADPNAPETLVFNSPRAAEKWLLHLKELG